MKHSARQDLPDKKPFPPGAIHGTYNNRTNRPHPVQQEESFDDMRNATKSIGGTSLRRLAISAAAGTVMSFLVLGPLTLFNVIAELAPLELCIESLVLGILMAVVYWGVSSDAK